MTHLSFLCLFCGKSIPELFVEAEERGGEKEQRKHHTFPLFALIQVFWNRTIWKHEASGKMLPWLFLLFDHVLTCLGRECDPTPEDSAESPQAYHLPDGKLENWGQPLSNWGSMWHWLIVRDLVSDRTAFSSQLCGLPALWPWESPSWMFLPLWNDTVHSFSDCGCHALF